MLIKTLLILFLIAMVLRLVMPTLLRWALTSFVKRQMRKGPVGFGPGFGPGGSPFGQPAPPPQPQGPDNGSVRVDYVPPVAKKARAKGEFRGGDYVEFEEVK